MRRLLATWLQRQGFEVVEAGTGLELEQLLAASASWSAGGAGIDVVISDVKMPGRSGLDVLARLRRVDGSTPVILITAFGDSAVRDKASRHGAILLDKPFSAKQLHATLAALGLVDDHGRSGEQHVP